MSNEVVKIGPQTLQNFTPEQLKLITNTVAKRATPDELQFFLYRCKNMGLDPLKPGQIHFVKYGDSPGTVVIGIEGFRSIAGRTGKLSGVKRGVIRNEQGIAIGGWAEVYRSDWQHPAREEVPMGEYNTGKGPWAKMPETMIKKVAEAATLRMAFPDDLGGVYESAEMDQADKGVYPEPPGENDGIQSNEYLCPSNLTGKFGSLRLKPISKADPVLLREAIENLEANAKRMKKELPEWAEVFIQEALPFIVAYENAFTGETEPGAAE